MRFSPPSFNEVNIHHSHGRSGVVGAADAREHAELRLHGDGPVGEVRVHLQQRAHRGLVARCNLLDCVLVPRVQRRAQPYQQPRLQRLRPPRPCGGPRGDSGGGEGVGFGEGDVGVVGGPHLQPVGLEALRDAHQRLPRQRAVHAPRHVDGGAGGALGDGVERAEADAERPALGARLRGPVDALVEQEVVGVLGVGEGRAVEEPVRRVREAVLGGVREALAAKRNLNRELLDGVGLAHVDAQGRHAAVDVGCREHGAVGGGAGVVGDGDGLEGEGGLGEEARVGEDAGDEARRELQHAHREEVVRRVPHRARERRAPEVVHGADARARRAAPAPPQPLAGGEREGEVRSSQQVLPPEDLARLEVEAVDSVDLDAARRVPQRALPPPLPARRPNRRCRQVVSDAHRRARPLLVRELDGGVRVAGGLLDVNGQRLVRVDVLCKHRQLQLLADNSVDGGDEVILAACRRHLQLLWRHLQVDIGASPLRTSAPHRCVVAYPRIQKRPVSPLGLHRVSGAHKTVALPGPCRAGTRAVLVADRRRAVCSFVGGKAAKGLCTAALRECRIADRTPSSWLVTPDGVVRLEKVAVRIEYNIPSQRMVHDYRERQRTAIKFAGARHGKNMSVRRRLDPILAARPSNPAVYVAPENVRNLLPGHSTNGKKQCRK
mmetsp:Transcript_23127/g.54830  ORF Transcript_23127/g.54830 Transcript_23127/m.54830 type:complete len:663 (-) Transcript_23127:264-2252(-)